ncbi:MAG: SGNH/GDSL hydrolase family protein, partial [Planctomycetota bacterium]|nr:SGNH/GDSL hydrolase family protein [Planctomycetota bacterium]
MSDAFDNLAAPSQQRSPRRKWLLRGLSVALGLSVFVVVELVCVILGPDEMRLDDDPFVGFSNLQPLFERKETGDSFVTSRSRMKFFAKDEFPAHKPPGTRRIFCLGGSTVQGRPFSTETSFTKWLELALQQAQPDFDWDVINCGGISYASYRLTPILQECLNYEPDAFILCTGHNEFLEDRTYGELRDVSPMLTVPFYGLARLRSFRLFRQWLLRRLGQPDTDDVSNHRSVLGSNVDAFLDYRNGIDAYHRDDDWRHGVVAHFENNLERMVLLAKQHGVPIVLVSPPSNLADTAPFKSEHRLDLTDQELARWSDTVERARTTVKAFPAAAVSEFGEAIRIDPDYAATHFELGRLLELIGDFEAAREEFLLARELDICPLRILASMELAIDQVAKRNDVPLLNAHELLERETRNGILGSSMLVDHIHPSFNGHQLIALALVKHLHGLSIVKPANAWQPLARAAFAQHFAQLPDVYFAKGEQNLANLRRWSQGMTDGPRIESRPRQRAMS